jgi:hypothetical protein
MARTARSLLYFRAASPMSLRDRHAERSFRRKQEVDAPFTTYGLVAFDERS